MLRVTQKKKNVSNVVKRKVFWSLQSLLMVPYKGLGVVCITTPRAVKLLVFVRNNRFTELMQMHRSFP